MDMQTKPHSPLNFHLTGRRQAQALGDGLSAIDGLGLRPALLAPYRDLNALRHDFPLVLVEGPEGADVVRSLSSLVDAVLRDLAPRGIEGERLRRLGLQLEQEIRRAVDQGARGKLSQLWQDAAARLGADPTGPPGQVLSHVVGALRTDGEVLGCTHDMPARLITHAWKAAHRAQARQFHVELSRLVRKLSDILRAAFWHSQAGRQPQSLRASVGGPHQDLFDFDALSRIVGQGTPHEELSPSRHERLQRTLATLESQRFFAPPDAAQPEGVAAAFSFEFDSCAAAAQAFRERLPAMVDLVKALSIAELEARGCYVEADDDPFFEAFDEFALNTDDIARFPHLLVCIPPDRNDAEENANLMEMLSSGVPVKVLVQTSDLLEDAAVGGGRLAFGVRSARLATTAMGLGGMFVLQSTSANLVAMRAQIGSGLVCSGPALFSVFSGPADAPDATLPPYLVAAAAMQSRAFPAFVYDAQAGSNWAERFSLANNPQFDLDWPRESLEYVDTAQQRIVEPCAFTFADFVLCDPRCASSFALIARAQWSAEMMPAADWLALDEQAASQRVPYVLAVDADDALQRVVVSARLMQSTRRCLMLWRRLQEHGGIHDSHAERLLAHEKAAWTALQQASAPAPGVAEPPAAPPPVDADVEPATPAHSRDEAWIETARCPSCNECTQINNRMFAYDERQQAFIKDLSAGSYRQLVEAAESCQVAIIHPGKPRDPNEPGLEELLVRADAFR